MKFDILEFRISTLAFCKFDRGTVSAMGEHLTKFTEGFRAIVNRHLIDLNYGAENRKALSDITGISQGQIADWWNGVRLPGRDRISEICFYLAGEYEKKRKEIKEKQIGPKTLDGMLNEMLEAVGYSPAIGAKSLRDQIWSRLAGSDKRELKVAWVRYPPFAYTDAAGRRRGVAVDIMERVAKLMGAVVTWEEQQWPSLLESVANRDVDMVAPLLLELPSRMFQVAFSTSIPKIAIGISGLVNRANEPQITASGVCLNYVRGEAGEALCTMFVPDAASRQEHETFERAWQHITKHGTDEEGKINCLVADHVICKELETATRGILKTVESREVGGSETVKLPIAIGIHLLEPKLLQVVNECIDILRETNWFDRYWAEEDDGKRLMEIHAAQIEVKRRQDLSKRASGTSGSAKAARN